MIIPIKPSQTPLWSPFLDVILVPSESNLKAYRLSGQILFTQELSPPMAFNPIDGRQFLACSKKENAIKIVNINTPKTSKTLKLPEDKPVENVKALNWYCVEDLDHSSLLGSGLEVEEYLPRIGTENDSTLEMAIIGYEQSIGVFVNSEMYIDLKLPTRRSNHPDSSLYKSESIVTIDSKGIITTTEGVYQINFDFIVKYSLYLKYVTHIPQRINSIIRTIQTTLSSLPAPLPFPAEPLPILETIMIGRPIPSNVAPELAKWRKSQTAQLDQSRRSIIEVIIPNSERLLLLLSTMIGLGKWVERGKPLGIDHREVSVVQKLASTVLSSAHKELTRLNQKYARIRDLGWFMDGEAFRLSNIVEFLTQKDEKSGGIENINEIHQAWRTVTKRISKHVLAGSSVSKILSIPNLRSYNCYHGTVQDLPDNKCIVHLFQLSLDDVVMSHRLAIPFQLKKWDFISDTHLAVLSTTGVFMTAEYSGLMYTVFTSGTNNDDAPLTDLNAEFSKEFNPDGEYGDITGFAVNYKRKVGCITFESHVEIFELENDEDEDEEEDEDEDDGNEREH